MRTIAPLFYFQNWFARVRTRFWVLLRSHYQILGMMLDFEVQRCTRLCAKTQRELKPGETIYSVLVAEGEEVVRQDYCEEAWQGPPEELLGWWKSQMPQPNARKVNWAPNDVMLHYFEQLAGQVEKEDTRYVMALLMLRRRIVRLDETEEDQSGRQVMFLFCPRNENQYEVFVVEPNGSRIQEIQQELAQLLEANAA